MIHPTMSDTPINDRSAYYAEIAKKTTFILVCMVLLLLAAVMSCAIGTGYGFF